MGILSDVHDEAASQADRHARRGEWSEASVHCAQAIADVERLRAEEPDDPAHVTSLAELRYFYAEVLRNLHQIDQAVREAQASVELFRALVSIDPVHLADRARDAESRLGVLQVLADDEQRPPADRVPTARDRAAASPSPHHDLDLARHLARQGLSTGAVDELAEAVSIYRHLRPLGEDDLDLFAQASIRVAEAQFVQGGSAEAAEYAGDAAQAYGALALRHPERYDRRWYEAREMAARARDVAEIPDP
jgi:hypothetical protein